MHAESESGGLSQDDSTSVANLRASLNRRQAAVLNRIWDHYRETGAWIGSRRLRLEFRNEAIQDVFKSLGGSIVYESTEYPKSRRKYELTLLGILLTDFGPRYDALLSRYVGYLCRRVEQDPELVEVSSEDAARDLGLGQQEVADLGRILWAGHSLSAGGSYGGTRWSFGVPDFIEEFIDGVAPIQYVHQVALRNFDFMTPVDGDERSAFWSKRAVVAADERHAQVESAEPGSGAVPEGRKAMSSATQWDVFMSHASEDKKDVVIPLSAALEDLGISVWLDSNELKLGQSLSRMIAYGLANSRFGVVILSEHFFAKHWPKQELAGLTALAEERDSRILPVWHGLTKQAIAAHDPILADIVASTTKSGIVEAASAIAKTVLPTKAVHMPPWLRQGAFDGLRRAKSVIVHLRTIDSNRPRDPNIYCDLVLDGLSGMVTLYPLDDRVPREVHVSEIIGVRYTGGPSAD